MKNPKIFYKTGIVLILIFAILLIAETHYYGYNLVENTVLEAVVTLKTAIGILTGIVLWTIGMAYKEQK